MIEMLLCIPEFEFYTQSQGVPLGAPASTDNSSVGYRGLCQCQRTSTVTRKPAHMKMRFWFKPWWLQSRPTMVGDFTMCVSSVSTA